MADDILAMAKELYAARIADMAEERSRLLARIAELERENRALWYASGKFREVCGSMTGVVAELASSGNSPETDGSEALRLVCAADKVLGDIVPLATA